MKRSLLRPFLHGLDPVPEHAEDYFVQRPERERYRKHNEGFQQCRVGIADWESYWAMVVERKPYTAKSNHFTKPMAVAQVTIFKVEGQSVVCRAYYVAQCAQALMLG